MPVPSNANRSNLDQTQIMQRSFDESTDRLRVDAAVTIDTGQLDIILTHQDDSIRLGDGTNFLTSTTGGGKVSLDVNLTNNTLDVDINQATDSIKIGDGTNLVTSTSVSGKQGLDVNVVNPIAITTTTPITSKLIPNGATASTFNQISSVATGVLTIITTYTVPMGIVAYLARVEYSGTNIADYTLYLNGTPIDKKLTYFGGSLETVSNFDVSISVGLQLAPGDVVQTKVLHQRPDPGDFSSRILAMEI